MTALLFSCQFISRIGDKAGELVLPFIISFHAFHHSKEYDIIVILSVFNLDATNNCQNIKSNLLTPLRYSIVMYTKSTLSIQAQVQDSELFQLRHSSEQRGCSWRESAESLWVPEDVLHGIEAHVVINHRAAYCGQVVLQGMGSYNVNTRLHCECTAAQGCL